LCVPSAPGAEQAVAAERLDRGDFVIQKRQNDFSIYQRDTFEPPTERQAVGRHTSMPRRCDADLYDALLLTLYQDALPVAEIHL
jgi:hypothetical protein